MQIFGTLSFYNQHYFDYSYQSYVIIIESNNFF
jgi:hypothetical protein